MILTFPWPPSTLSPNTRLHWTKLHKAKKDYYAECHYSQHKVLPKILGKRKFKITFSPPDNRRRDVDNTIAACKVLVDLLSFHAGIDDSKFQIVWPRKFSPPVDGGAVIVEVMG